MAEDYPVISFDTAADFRLWLAAGHLESPGVWLKIYKKATGIPTVTYAEALDEALCYGWIDGQRKARDDQSFIQKFTPRRPRSLWSKRNIEHVARLEAAGRLTAAGRAEVELAQVDGRWAAAYDGPSTMEVPADFLAALTDRPVALAAFEGLNKTQRYAIAWRLATARKPETRQRRLETLLARLEEGD